MKLMKLKELVDSFDSHSDFIKEVDNQLLALMNEQPDFVYNDSGKNAGCHYNGPATYWQDTEDGINGKLMTGPACSGCIFGQALQRMGWEAFDFNVRVSGLIQLEGGVSGSVQPDYWQTIQTYQDGGTKWGDLKKYMKED